MSDNEQRVREHCAQIVEELRSSHPWNEKPWAKMALFIAARAIRRGRNLTAAEKLENLAKSFEDEGEPEVAQIIRMRR